MLIQILSNQSQSELNFTSEKIFTKFGIFRSIFSDPVGPRANKMRMSALDLTTFEHIVRSGGQFVDIFQIQGRD